MSKVINFKIILPLVFIGLFLLFLPRSIQAATLTISPSTNTYRVGNTFSVGIYVNSADQAMNAASGVVSFPSDKLEVTSISKAGSIFSLWVLEPAFSNSAGTVNYEGIVLNPGYTGAGGKLMTINFRAKAPGVATVNFSAGAVLANDGKGTNIINGLGSANYNIEVASVGPQPPDSTTPTPVVGALQAPVVSSGTHPDPEQWYNNNNPAFDWSLPSGVTGVSISIDKNSNSNPGPLSDGILDGYQYENIEDGEWYFHIRLKNKNGWGAITHFRFQIDTEKPESFNISQVVEEDKTNPNASFIMEAFDTMSGIDYYEIQIDDQELVTWQDSGDHIFVTPAILPGQHVLIAKAFDQAGNMLANTANFVIAPLPTPKITDYDSELKTGDYLVVKGETEPRFSVALWLQRDDEKPVKQLGYAGHDGKFTLVYEGKLKDGVYKMWFVAHDDRGAASLPTDELTIIAKPSTILKLGNQLLVILTLFLPLFALLLLIILLIWYIWRKYKDFRKKLKRQIVETDYNVHQALEALRRDIQDHLNMLNIQSNKRKLSEKEKDMIRLLRKDLDGFAFDVEKYISREIQDIPNDLGKHVNKIENHNKENNY